VLLSAAQDNCKHPALTSNPRLPTLTGRRDFRQAAAWGIFHWAHGLLTSRGDEESPDAHAVAALLGPPFEAPAGWAFLHNLYPDRDWHEAFAADQDRLATLRPVLDVLAGFGRRPVLAGALGLSPSAGA
jgi:hypothetical protein